VPSRALLGLSFKEFVDRALKETREGKDVSQHQTLHMKFYDIETAITISSTRDNSLHNPLLFSRLTTVEHFDSFMQVRHYIFHSLSKPTKSSSLASQNILLTLSTDFPWGYLNETHWT
jgi:hypothetical protein